MTIAALPTPPTRSDPTNFPTRGDAFMSALPQFVSDCNALAAGLNSLAAGGAYAIPYTVDLSSTTDADPGNGNLRFDNATQNLATTLRLDLVGADTNTYTAVLDTFDASTSTVKGVIRIVKQGDVTKFLMFNVTARSAPTGYRDISVTAVASSSSNPFAQGDPVMLFFQRTGDKGATGATAFPTFRVQDQKAAGTTGGSSVAGVQTRTLNTVCTNTLAGASLSSNQVTLSAGTYKVTGSAPAYQVASHQALLYSITGSAYLLYGTTEYSFTSSSSQTRSAIVGEITLSGTTVLELRHYTQSAVGSSGLGSVSANMAGATMLYSEILFEKVG